MKDQYLVSCVLSISVMTGSVGAPPVSWLVLFPLFPEEVARLKSKFCDDEGINPRDMGFHPNPIIA